jgi:endonuclease/exonuclease/phosphatase family metal-dependent hydrolase
LIDGNDSRGIDVGLYSKLEIVNVRTNIFDGPGNSRTFPRDCLEVEVRSESGESVFILVNHFTSKWGTNSAATDQRRGRQANRVSEILDERYDLINQYVVVAGDLNDTPDRPPLQPLLAKPNLHDVLKEQFPHEPAKRWTYHFESNEQIDYILVSEKLKGCLTGAGVERRGMDDVDEYSNGEISPYNSVTNWRDAASDHGAVWAVFNV